MDANMRTAAPTYCEMPFLESGCSPGYADRRNWMVKRAGGFRKLFRHRYDVLARHPVSEEVVEGVENVDEAAAGHATKRFLDDGYFVDVRDRRSGRVKREIPVSKTGIYHRERLEAERPPKGIETEGLAPPEST